jgi:HEAT repeat protein
VDLSPEVREAAARALKDRPPQDYQDFLLEGLQYPWPPVADHAAEALAMLQCRDSIPKLAQLLQRPEPDAPSTVKVGKRVYRVAGELVRVNHLGNCLLCHAPSSTKADLVRGAVPTPGQPLPAPVTMPQGYEGGGTFIRADITYLRQHFSVMHAVPNPGAWPTYQRYDYLVRLRPLGPNEVTLRTQSQTERRTFPQREAILFALRELTGRDLGPSPENWKALLPAEEQQADAARLGSDLVNSPPGQQETLLAKLRDSKGLPYTDALAEAIPPLGLEAKEKARDALAQRLTRMTAATLRDKLQDDNAEVRRAASLACAMKESRAHVPDLIPLLEDPEVSVARAAHAALKSLTGKDFGPTPNAPRRARQEAAAKWLVWWKKQLGS